MNRFRFRAAHILWALAGLTASLLLVAVIIFWPDPKEPPRLLATPAHSGPLPNLPSYRGVHPAVSARPEESFPFPIPLGTVGPATPLFAGPLRYPFLCQTQDSDLGQPLVDNQQGIGVAVYETLPEGAPPEAKPKIVGYSKDCGLPTQVLYYYQRRGEPRFYPLDEAAGDIARVELNGRAVEMIVRVEVGTINRHIYMLASLAGPDDKPEVPDLSHWNQRLIYQFRGGVGVGHKQGRIDIGQRLERRIDQLMQGYALAYSSANQTSNHYNLLLAEDTARRVKQQFVSRYGAPLYTVGIGGSGGAIQQYILAQNAPGLLDGAIPLYGYPDMITQTIYAFDCELLEHYFDVTAADNPKWRQWESRQWVEGLRAGPAPASMRQVAFDLARVLQGAPPQLFSGSSECVHGWRGLTPLTHNPHYLSFADELAPEVYHSHHWSHWEDLRHVYGTDANGYARSSWDNVGVQYGLDALKDGKITPEEFLHLNRHVGGWKPASAMQQERFWRWGGEPSLWRFSPWSHHNMTRAGAAGATAPRSEGDPQAIEAAYRSGLVFLGELPIPAIALRHYLEPELDMHHTSASFSTRRRIEQAGGETGNHLIWVAHKDHNPVPDAFALIDRWLVRLKAMETPVVAEARPEEALDRCYDAQGIVIAQGQQVWDGAWNGRPTGPCMARYPIYSDSRQVAGADLSGLTFKCALQPVEKALEKGLYGPVEMTPHLPALKAIFPQGVCDYQRPSPWLPSELLRPLKTAHIFSLNPGAETRVATAAEGQERSDS
ncbi:DUF6351 family protein [Motiliproteus sp. SC1-56]|uniref:DUF6351 family protein n=1 Tax=Motiliproteus sp. SC1-56 TaxID=2799565 RepID=UPI001A8CCB65|nr:DUF6351 family protein [Motiliproteus sp. SC1-56]